MIQKIVLYALIAEAHETAVKAGWHERPLPLSDYVALMNSELGEAVECLRTNADPLVWSGVARKDKPEGFVFEMADFCIRIFDFVGDVGIKVQHAERVAVEAHVAAFKNAEQAGAAGSAAEIVCVAGEALFTGWRKMLEKDLAQCLAHLGAAVGLIDCWFMRNGIRLENVIREKMDYNKTREYRHGGKLS